MRNLIWKTIVLIRKILQLYRFFVLIFMEKHGINVQRVRGRLSIMMLSLMSIDVLIVDNLLTKVEYENSELEQ